LIETKGKERNPKVLSVFQIVRFANDPCISSTRNGTCYTSEECESRGGTNAGSCASGYGVCCTFSISCNARSSENCTYFESPAQLGAGTCRATICPCTSNICQLRLDFENFVITGPSTLSESVTKVSKGGLLDPNNGAKALSLATQCLTDTFDVTTDSHNVPTICGVNRGQHMYVEADDDCNDLVFQLGAAGNGVGAVAARMFSIKVTQYSCDFVNLAPEGCVQYYFGSTTGMVQNYNYDNGNGVHLANQDQSICIRRERGQCRICWFTETPDMDFQISGPTNVVKGYTKTSACCGYSGEDAKIINGYDCVNIPGAVKSTAKRSELAGNFCGRLLVSENSKEVADIKTICTTRAPFYIRFRSDPYEYADAAMSEFMKPGAGFDLRYSMDSENCN